MGSGCSATADTEAPLFKDDRQRGASEPHHQSGPPTLSFTAPCAAGVYASATVGVHKQRTRGSRSGGGGNAPLQRRRSSKPVASDFVSVLPRPRPAMESNILTRCHDGASAPPNQQTHVDDRGCPLHMPALPLPVVHFLRVSPSVSAAGGSGAVAADGGGAHVLNWSMMNESQERRLFVDMLLPLSAATTCESSNALL